jgi:hypothetical protein
MPTLKKNFPSPISVALYVFGLCMLGILVFCSYEMIVVFIDAVAEKAGTVNEQIMSAGMAGY